MENILSHRSLLYAHLSAVYGVFAEAILFGCQWYVLVVLADPGRVTHGGGKPCRRALDPLEQW